MKTTITLVLLTFVSLSLHSETIMETAPITGDDLASVLNLNIEKTKILFDSPKIVTLRWETPTNSQEYRLDTATKDASLMTYISAEGGPDKMLHFWISGAGACISSYFSFDSSKAKYRRSEIIDGVFTIIGSENKDFTGTLAFRIQVLNKNE